MMVGNRGEAKNFFSREKKSFASPRTPLHFSKKAGYFGEGEIGACVSARKAGYFGEGMIYPCGMFAVPPSPRRARRRETGACVSAKKAEYFVEGETGVCVSAKSGYFIEYFVI